MRSWKISVVGVGSDGEEQRLPYVDYVEYILHHTFEQPLRSTFFSRNQLIVVQMEFGPLTLLFSVIYRGHGLSLCAAGERLGRV